MVEVLHISHTDVLEDARIKRTAFELAKADRFKVRVIGYGACRKSVSSDTVDFFVFRDPRLYMEGLPRLFGFRGLMMVFIFQFFAIFTLVGMVWRFRPKIIHCHDNFLLLSATLMCILSRAKLIYDAHELEHNKNGQARYSRFFVHVIERVTAPYWSGFITVSESILSYYKETFSIGCRAVTVYNSPVSHGGHGSQALARDRGHSLTERKTFVYVGYLSRGRGIEIILSVFKNLDCADLVFIGGGELEAAIVESSRHFPHIRHVPPIPHEELIDFISGYDYGLCFLPDVSLSDRYALPNKFIEYISAGLRVVCSSAPEIAHFTTKYNLGYVGDFNPDWLSNCVIELSSANFSRVSCPYELAWEAQSKKLYEIYAYL